VATQRCPNPSAPTYSIAVVTDAPWKAMGAYVVTRDDGEPVGGLHFDREPGDGLGRLAASLYATDLVAEQAAVAMGA
jgi:hypothetical protein